MERKTKAQAPGRREPAEAPPASGAAPGDEAPVEATVLDDAAEAGGPEATGTEGAEPEGAEPEGEVDELERARRESEQFLDDLKRLKAEFENYRKRVLREQTTIVEHATQALIERLLPVLDNFELALIAADATKDAAKLARGVEMVYGELRDVLEKEGLRQIEAAGKPFDPERHEAVMQSDDGGEGELIVAEVFRPGYALGDRVIRPAMVKVARRPTSHDGASDESRQPSR